MRASPPTAALRGGDTRPSLPACPRQALLLQVVAGLQTTAIAQVPGCGTGATAQLRACIGPESIGAGHLDAEPVLHKPRCGGQVEDWPQPYLPWDTDQQTALMLPTDPALDALRSALVLAQDQAVVLTVLSHRQGTGSQTGHWVTNRSLGHK